MNHFENYCVSIYQHFCVMLCVFYTIMQKMFCQKVFFCYYQCNKKSISIHFLSTFFSSRSLSSAQICLNWVSSLFTGSVLGGFAGIGEVGQQWWPRTLRKGKARLSLGGTDKTSFQRQSRSLWRNSERGRSGSQWNNLATLMWKGKVINSSICSLLTLPFTQSPAGMAESDTMH